MTDSATIAIPAPESTGRRPTWKEEARSTLALAGPIILTLLSQAGMTAVDLVMIGRLGEAPLAAVSLAWAAYFTAFIFGAGTVMAVAPLAAQFHGARKPRQVRRVVRQGLWVTIALTGPAIVTLHQLEPFFVAVGQPAGAAALAQHYLDVAAFALPAAVSFIVLRNFAAALGRPQLGLWVILVGLPANAALNYVLIYGHFGMPRLELPGAALATVIVETLMLVAMATIATRVAPLRRYRVLARFWRADWTIFRRILRVGLPIAGLFMLEVGMFAVTVVMIGWIGTTALAGHQIAIQYASFVFRVAAGIGQAATVRVGHAVGRHDAPAIGRAGWAALAVGVAAMVMASTCMWLLSDRLPWVFLGADGDGTRAVAAVAAQLVVVAAIFLIADGAQVIGAGALRGLGDTAVPMLWAALGFWGIGLGSGYVFGFALGYGAVGIWSGLAIGFAFVALCHALRFRRLTARGRVGDSLARAHLR